MLKLNKNYRYARLYALRINRSRSVYIYIHIYKFYVHLNSSLEKHSLIFFLLDPDSCKRVGELLVPVNIETAFDPPQIKSFQFGPFVNEIVPARNYESRSLRKVFEVRGGLSPRATLRVK